MTNTPTQPVLGILCWEEGGNPRGLQQLESLVGNSMNPASYPFAVAYQRVKGANYHSVVESRDKSLLGPMIQAARILMDKGVRAITTSCGFNAIYQRELAEVLEVPVFTSALLQIPLIQATTGNREILVITASSRDLQPVHFQAVGVEEMRNIHVRGMDEMAEWSKIRNAPDEELCIETIRKEIVTLADNAIKSHPQITTIVLECTDLPPFAGELRTATKLPVYDLLTLVTQLHGTLPLTACSTA